eukprot:218686-Amorphochlora_amoeboformis.AAC.1
MMRCDVTTCQDGVTSCYVTIPEILSPGRDVMLCHGSRNLVTMARDVILCHDSRNFCKYSSSSGIWQCECVEVNDKPNGLVET